MNKTKVYDALIVLGAVMRWDKSIKKWTFPLILQPEEYSGLLVLGEWRAKAASILENEAKTIIVTGGFNKHPETGMQVSRAEELARLIIEMGVPKGKVIVLNNIGGSNTSGNVAAIDKYLSDHLEINKVAVLSPRFQMKRAKLIHQNYSSLKRAGLDFEWIEVEETLIKNNPEFKREIDRIYSTPEASICMQKEEEGIEQLFIGKYK